jgi:hypothetical protein
MRENTSMMAAAATTRSTTTFGQYCATSRLQHDLLDDPWRRCLMNEMRSQPLNVLGQSGVYSRIQKRRWILAGAHNATNNRVAQGLKALVESGDTIEGTEGSKVRHGLCGTNFNRILLRLSSVASQISPIGSDLGRLWLLKHNG